MFFNKLIYGIHSQKKIDHEVYDKDIDEYRNNKSNGQPEP